MPSPGGRRTGWIPGASPTQETNSEPLLTVLSLLDNKVYFQAHWDAHVHRPKNPDGTNAKPNADLVAIAKENPGNFLYKPCFTFPVDLAIAPNGRGCTICRALFYPDKGNDVRFCFTGLFAQVSPSELCSDNPIIPEWTTPIQFVWDNAIKRKALAGIWNDLEAQGKEYNTQRNREDRLLLAENAYYENIQELFGNVAEDGPEIFRYIFSCCFQGKDPFDQATEDRELETIRAFIEVSEAIESDLRAKQEFERAQKAAQSREQFEAALEDEYVELPRLIVELKHNMITGIMKLLIDLLTGNPINWKSTLVKFFPELVFVNPENESVVVVNAKGITTKLVWKLGRRLLRK